MKVSFLSLRQEISAIAYFKCRSFILLLTYAGGKITVVANDGNDVEPVEVDRLIIVYLKPMMW
jgi:hypothetical protein